MNSFWLFRSNLKHLEYYHQYTNLNDFIKLCHDFYLIQGFYFLDKNYFDEVIIWRLIKSPKNDIVFYINGKKFIQRFVTDFKSCFKLPSPVISFWRGGFPEYCQVTKSRPSQLGMKLYLAAGKRTFPLYGGIYDKILVESEIDMLRDNCVPFYKTANPLIFKPLDIEKEFDFCWICNFEQITQKGQEFFISSISNSKNLRKLKILHVGNKPDVARKLCKKYGVNNIVFSGSVDRFGVNLALNRCKFCILTSNRKDGCPRVSTESIVSGTPLLIRDQTRLLSYYKQLGVVEYKDNNIEEKILTSLENYSKLRYEILENRERCNINHICELNLKEWSLL